MKAALYIAIASALCVLTAAPPASAHHSFSAVFDVKSPVTLKGTVTKFEFVNPHGRVYFDVKDEKANAVKWSAEVSNPNAMLRLGWNKNTLKPGDVITITGVRARDGSHFILGQSFTLPDGRQLFSNAPNSTR